MNLSDLKRIAAARTKGEWGFYLQSAPGRPPVLFSKDQDKTIGTFNRDHMSDAAFSAMASNKIDAMLEVIEAAKKLTLCPIGHWAENDELVKCLVALERE